MDESRAPTHSTAQFFYCVWTKSCIYAWERRRRRRLATLDTHQNLKNGQNSALYDCNWLYNGSFAHLEFTFNYNFRGQQTSILSNAALPLICWDSALPFICWVCSICLESFRYREFGTATRFLQMPPRLYYFNSCFDYLRCCS